MVQSTRVETSAFSLIPWLVPSTLQTATSSCLSHPQVSSSCKPSGRLWPSSCWKGSILGHLCLCAISLPWWKWRDCGVGLAALAPSV